MSGPWNEEGGGGGEEGRAGEQRGNGKAPLPIRTAISSVTSFSEDDYSEMATEEMYAGPVSESIPSSVSAFAHRRSRADSEATEGSFRFFREEYDDDEALHEASSIAVSESERVSLGRYSASHTSRSHRSASIQLSRHGSEPLLARPHLSESEPDLEHLLVSQKVYLEEEDLTIVIAGFTTSHVGSLIYYCICWLTLGLGFLLLRWSPSWRVRLIGSVVPLGESDWVVIENEWREMIITDVRKHEYGDPVSTVFGQHGRKTSEEDEEEDPRMPILRFFDYRYIRFLYHPFSARFILNNNWKDPEWTDIKKIRGGIDSDVKDGRLHIFGQNSIDIEEKKVGQLLIDEALHPFYIFQVFSVILWSLDEYYYYATCILVISAVSVASTIISTKETMRRLREMAKFVCDVRVLRSGFWRYIPSSDLVPGDIYEASDPSLTIFPCDSVLLAGDCIVNESMLTGESVPVSKNPVTEEALSLLKLSTSTIFPGVARHFLFSGTKIVRVRRPEADEEEAVALAMVVRTGFNTTKGALVRSMLFPKPTGFKFYRDSFRYIGVMSIIALLGFALSLVNFMELGLPWTEILLRAGDLVTIVVPPALPATLTIGTNFAISRLQKLRIYCISPSRVNVGGKLDLLCFDKTGTLTEDGLDVLGVRVMLASQSKLGEIQRVASDLHASGDLNYRQCLHSMATCHSLRVVDDELVGDPLDLKMFQFTEWSFSESGGRDTSKDERSAGNLAPSIARPPDGSCEGELEIGILRSFDFVSHLRRMSVITKTDKSSSSQVYVKGAPEVMPGICTADSLPSDYEEQLYHYTHAGFRVIACATKPIKMSWLKVQKLSREEVERDLTFLAFILFENKLKPITTQIMAELERANLRKVMCTGDNVLTAISVARECRLVDPAAFVFVPRFEIGHGALQDSKILWEGVDCREYTLDTSTLLPNPPPPSSDASPPALMNLSNYSLAVTGDVFRWIVDYASVDVLQRMLVKGQIFARMSPDEKHELVEKLQTLDYTVGFCGDGANDCGALKAADVGISLSEAEASVAAPFTSRVFDVSCVPQVIKEGRAALVTSFSCFKYMSLYSAIQFVTVSILYKHGSNLGDFQFLLIDLFLIIPIAVFMGWAGPFPTLSRKPPTADLVSRKVLVPLLGQIFLCGLTQAIVYALVQTQAWYRPPVLGPKPKNIRNSVNTSLFMVSCAQYILIGVVLSVGRPFRQPMYQNGNLLLLSLFNFSPLCHHHPGCPGRQRIHSSESRRMGAQYPRPDLPLLHLQDCHYGDGWGVLLPCLHRGQVRLFEAGQGNRASETGA